MNKEKLEKQLVIYESPDTEITSVEQARAEVAFLHKAYSLGMFNKMLYLGNGGFHKSINADNIESSLDEIVKEAEKGNFPHRYSIGMNVGFDGTKVDTKIFEEH